MKKPPKILSILEDIFFIACMLAGYFLGYWLDSFTRK